MLRGALLLLLYVALVSADDIARSYSEFGGKPYSVSYNSRSMLLDKKPVLLMSGSVHYPRCASQP